MNKNLVDREISWLRFNERLLQEANDKSNPLLERLRFIGIYSNNRDEFFRVRVATLRRLSALKKQNKQTKEPTTPLTYDPIKVLKQIRKTIDQQEQVYMSTYDVIIEELKQVGINFVDDQNLSEEQKQEVRNYFRTEVHQNLFPIMLKSLKDAGNLKDNSNYLAIILKKSKDLEAENYALIQIPTKKMSRFFMLSKTGDIDNVMFLDDVIRFNLREIFLPFGYDTFESYSIKFTRDSEMDMDNDVSKSFLETMIEGLKQRRKGHPVRFIYDKNMPKRLFEKLKKKFKFSKDDLIPSEWRNHNFKDFMKFPSIGDSQLRTEKIKPLRHPDLPLYKSIFSVLQKKDIMLHYPYQSFNHVIDLLREASIDPKVTSIKATLYRAAKDSKVINALINAARNGKNVTVFMELQARFDEEANIYWTGKLQEEGVKIIKTIAGLKVHCKLISICRREESGDVYYSNISTGNFNESTAQQYADDSLFTANQAIGTEVSQMFKLFEMPYLSPDFRQLIISPYYMRNFFIKLIDNEIKNQKKGKSASIILKMNSLADEQLVMKLYQASQAGVKIKIICRGICILIPDLKEVSENIEVISIVDRCLEHSRVFYFENAGNPLYYISSADWMIRNLDRRFEVVCPVKNAEIQKELYDMLQMQLHDNKKARIVNGKKSNEYKKQKTADESVRSQEAIYNYFKQKSEKNIKRQ